MGNFFKRFGKGILYVIVCPFTVVVLALYAVYGVVVFMWLIIKSIGLFFTGRSLKDDLPEDIEAKRILSGEPNVKEEEPKKEEERKEETISVYPSSSSMYSSPYISPEPEIDNGENTMEDRPLSNPEEMSEISLDDEEDNNEY